MRSGEPGAARSRAARASRSTRRSSSRSQRPGASPSATATGRPRRRAGRQPAGAAGQAWVDGPAAAGLSRSRLLDTDDRDAERGGDLPRPWRRGPPGLMRGYPSERRRAPVPMRGGVYRTGDVAIARRRRLSHLCRPRRRRVQGVRLPDQPVRAGERADRARGGGRGRGGAGARPDAAGGAESLRRAGGGRRAIARNRGVDLRASAASGWRRTSGSAASSSVELPKTISGKIRRVELRRLEEARTARAEGEYREEDFT